MSVDEQTVHYEVMIEIFQSYFMFNRTLSVFTLEVIFVNIEERTKAFAALILGHFYACRDGTHIKQTIRFRFIRDL